MTTQTPTEERVSRLAGAYEQVNERLSDVTQSVNTLQGEINAFRAEVNSRFNTLYVILATAGVGIGGAFAGLYAILLIRLP